MVDNKKTTFFYELAELLKPIEQLHQKKIKLLIHAGTPKTGTTSLQTYLDKRQRKLRGKGILYPHNLRMITNRSAPKHQWFEKNLITNHLDFFLENFKNVLSQVDDNTHTVVLSSEGIYNYWWDIPEQSKKVLVELSVLFDVRVWVWFREPIQFIESYYKQCIRNPKIEGNPCYGVDLSFSDMLDIPWFSKHLDYQGFFTECQSVFGVEHVSAFEYKGDMVQEVIALFGLTTAHDNPTRRQNNSLNSASINILRTINQSDIQPKDKESIMPHLKEIDTILGRYASVSLIDDESRTRVLEIANPVKIKNSQQRIY